MPEPALPAGRLSRGEVFSFRTLVRAGVLGATATTLFGACDDGTTTHAAYGAPCTPAEEQCGSVTGGGGGSTSTGGVSGNSGAAGDPNLGGEGGS